jgi:hypothetical protein
MMHEHTYKGKHVPTGAKTPWGGEETKWVYDSPCDENFRDAGTYWASGRYPNLMRVEGVWYHLSHRANILSLITNADIYLTVAHRDSLVSPTPVLIDAFGDMYNFCSQQGILHRLEKVVEPAQFKSMQSKSIARSIKKISAA